jgi:pimeloyl-ACP methyl ester carboxylesterase
MYRDSSDDLGRPNTGERARPLQTLVWYPAKRGDGASVAVRDYVNLWSTETTFEKPKMPLRATEWLAQMGPALDSHLRASQNAKAAAGRYPVVIYAPGGSQMSWENADLCEYLASFGYVVISSPSFGAASRSMTYDVDGTNAEASDIRFLLNVAHGFPNASPSPVAVIGASWGAMAGLFAAARDKRIAGLVALDGSTRYYPGVIIRAGDVQPETMSIPLLYFMQGDFSLEDLDRMKDPMRAGPNILLQWTRGDLIVAHMLGLAHASFSSMWQRREDYWSEYGNSPWQPGGYGREDAVTGYSWVAEYTLKFLDAYLKHDSAALAFLKRSAEENGAPKHVMSVRFQQGIRVARTYEDFRAEVGRAGFGHVLETYVAFRGDDPKFTLNEDVLADWAEELLGDEHLDEAIALLTLNEQIHADSSQAEVILGDAYRMSGNKVAAMACYQRAVAKDGTNLFAAKKLRELSVAH